MKIFHVSTILIAFLLTENGTNAQFLQLLSDRNEVVLGNCREHKETFTDIMNCLELVEDLSTDEFVLYMFWDLCDSYYQTNKCKIKMENCVSPEGLKIFSIEKELEKHICPNYEDYYYLNRNFITDFVDAGGIACFEDMQMLDEIKTCVEDYSYEFLTTHCSEIRTCVKNKLAKCESQNLTDVVDELFKIINNEIPCSEEVVTERIPTFLNYMQHFFNDECKEDNTKLIEMGNCLEYMDFEEIQMMMIHYRWYFCNVYYEYYMCRDIIRNCLNEEGLKILNTEHVVIKYICGAERNIAAEFFEEGGIECLYETQNEIKTCVEDFNHTLLTTHCSEIRTCMKDTLEKCPSKIPANIVDELFEVISNEIPCSNEVVNKRIPTFLNYIHRFFNDECREDNTTLIEMGLCLEYMGFEEIQIDEIIQDRWYPRWYLCEVYDEYSRCTNTIRNCLNEEGLKIFNIEHVLMKYICAKEKDIVSEFSYAGGIECLHKTQNEIKNCVEDSNHTLLTTHCSEIRTCMKDTLETCPSKIPANIVDELFEVISNEIPCSNEVVNERITTFLNYIHEFFYEECKEDNTTLIEMGRCLQYMGFEEIQIDEIVRWYPRWYLCEVYDEYSTCTKTIRNCLNEEGWKMFNIEHVLMKYICAEERDLVSEFSYAGGIECLYDTQNEIRTCVQDFNNTFLTDHCSEIRTCMKETLETCPSKIPADIVDELFEVINYEIPCSNEVVNERIPSFLNNIYYFFNDECKEDNTILIEMGRCLKNMGFEEIQINDIIRYRWYLCYVYDEYNMCTNIIRKCFNEEGLKMLNIEQIVMNYTCAQETNLVAEFFDAGGIECLYETQNEIQSCIDDSDYTFSVVTHCSGTIRTCVKDTLGTCSSKIPTNIVDELFEIIKNEIPCSNEVVNERIPKFLNYIHEFLFDKCKEDNRTLLQMGYCLKDMGFEEIQIDDIIWYRWYFCEVYNDNSICADTIRKCVNYDGFKILNIQHDLMKYICSEEKDPVAEFLNAGGMDCLNKTQNEIQNCVQDFNYTFLTSQCSEIRTCVKDKLETCPSKIPANIVDIIFETINSEIPCSNEKISAPISKLLNYVDEFLLDKNKEYNKSLTELGHCLKSIDFRINDTTEERFLCKIYPDVYKCTNIIRNYVNSEGLKILNIEHDFMKFVCLNETDPVAEILAADGMECLKATENEIKTCVKDYSYTFLTTHCSEIRMCVKDSLQRCSSRTLADLVDEFFHIINYQIPCF